MLVNAPDSSLEGVILEVADNFFLCMEVNQMPGNMFWHMNNNSALK